MKGSRTLVRDADGVSTAYTYDAVDRLKTVSSKTDCGNGLKETRTYDAAGRLQTLSVHKEGQAVSRFVST